MSLPHIHIHHQCGACGGSFQVDEKITALTYYSETCIILDAGVFTDHDHCDQPTRHIIFCRISDCDQCPLTSETITFHTDCFNLVKGLLTDGALRRFWVAATWRHPWRYSPPLLQTSEDPVDDFTRIASNVCQIPLLKTLPNEIKKQCLFSSAVPISHYGVMHLKVGIGGGQPRLTNRRQRNVIQLTIDARGLKAICRFSEPPEPRASSTDSRHFLYLFWQATKVHNIKVQFDIGLGRLNIPGIPTLQLWDSPTPPLRWIGIQPPRRFSQPPHIKRFTTISLKQCHGLTFFITHSGVASIYPHTSRSPFAFETFTTLIPGVQAHDTWFYLPLGKSEKIISLGLRFQVVNGLYVIPCFLVHLRSRNYVIGPSYTGQVFDITVSIKGRPPLIYEHPEEEDVHIPTIGCCSTGVSPAGTLIHTYSRIPPDSPPFRDAHLTTAPLRGVVEVKLFRSQTFCKGMILTYDNQTRRSLGQCRLGEDTHRHGCTMLLQSTESKASSHLERQSTWRLQPKAVLSLKKNESQRWNSSEMRGIIKFWSESVQTSLAVQETKEEES
ncbi:unnamed protein product [Clonostachys byssicola]|uniref:Uncharacterized protein n=1 Tax=Clonostachys byssicola TaxID=160290 RepID=A0A9N9UZ73_9HYPO|nr:unnamed protein product [Clonostachys byssicola]